MSVFRSFAPDLDYLISVESYKLAPKGTHVLVIHRSSQDKRNTTY